MADAFVDYSHDKTNEKRAVFDAVLWEEITFPGRFMSEPQELVLQIKADAEARYSANH